jgi:predicted glycosyltransferase
MNIWIDLANSPHVNFFLPLMQVLNAQKHDFFITMREFAQTVALGKKYGIEGLVVGKHGGRNVMMKFFNFAMRSRQLQLAAKGRTIDIAVSHNSYTNLIAGRMIGARVVTLMDYEGQPANHLAFRLAHKIIVPECFPAKALRRFGASPKKVYKYNGFKEQVYLSGFEPKESFFDDLAANCELNGRYEASKKVLVTVRSPATMAIYHRFENPLFEKLLENLNHNPEILAIILPRVPQQAEFIKNKFPNLVIPKGPLDGKNLCYYSDLVISAGGTMNREAAILGTPAYSIFLGQLPAVDKRLIEMGRMVHINNEKDLSQIRFEKKQGNNTLLNPNLLEEVAEEILTPCH